MEVRPLDGENSKREVMAVVRRRRWPFFTALFVGLALASAASMAVPKSYKCVTRIEVSANHAIPAPEFASKVDAVAKQMLSTESMERVAEELGLAGPGGSGTVEAARDILAGTRVEQEAATDGTCVIKVEHSSRDPQACFKVLSQLVGDAQHPLAAQIGERRRSR